MFNKFLSRGKSPPTSNEEKQGFICPECHVNFDSIELLSDHHITAHPMPGYEEQTLAPAISPTNGTHRNGSNSSAIIMPIKQDFAELETSLSEEKWFTVELQKELGKLQEENQQLKTKRHIGGGDVEVISRKAADLAVRVAQLQSQLDEEQSRALSAEEELAKAKITNEELVGQQMELQTELGQSTSKDDVLALKAELAKAQIHMDTILTEREKDGEMYQERIRSMECDKEKLEVRVGTLENLSTTQKEEIQLKAELVARLESGQEHASLNHTRLEGQLHENSSLIEDLRQRNKRLEEDVTSKEEEKKSLYSQIGGMTATLSQINTQMGRDEGVATSEMKQLAANFTDFQSSLGEKDKRNNELTAQISTLQTDVSRLTGEHGKLETQLRLAEKTIHTSTDRIATLTASSDKLKSLKQELEITSMGMNLNIKNLTTANTELKEELSRKTQLFVESEARCSVLGLEVDRLSPLKEEVKNQQGEIERLLLSETAANKQHADTLYTMDDKMAALRSEHSEISLNYERLREEKKGLDLEQIELKEKIILLEAEGADKSASLEERRDRAEVLEQENQAIVTEVVVLKQEIASSQEQLNTSASCMQELNERIDKKDERLLGLNSTIQRLEVDLAKPCDMCINYENKLNKCYAQIQELTTKYEETDKRAREAELLVTQFKESYEVIKTQSTALEGDLEQERQNAMNTENLLNRTRRELEENSNLLDGKIHMLENDLIQSQGRVSELEREGNELSKFKLRLETELSEAEGALAESSKLHSQELEDMRTKNGLLISQKLKLQEDIQVTNEQAEHSEAQLAVTKQKLLELREECTEQLKVMQNKVHIADNRADEVSRQLMESSSQHQEEVSTLSDQIHRQQLALQDSQGVIEELRKEGERLIARNNAHDATIENLTDERKIIHKRLIESEEKVQKLLEDNTGLVERFEKSQTALQEMAREQQHLLQVQENIQNRRWEDDSLVKECKSCVSEFSLTLRRHHCRNCGGVFCDKCSRFKSSTAASKAKVRVCEPCCKELNPP